MGATIGTRLMIWWKGHYVGEDHSKNRYYSEKNGRRRWVIFSGVADASAVPVEWHAWLHHTVAEPPLGKREEITWEQQHMPNQTGTSAAYHPAGKIIGSGVRKDSLSDYEAWRPDQMPE